MNKIKIVCLALGVTLGVVRLYFPPSTQKPLLLETRATATAKTITNSAVTTPEGYATTTFGQQQRQQEHRHLQTSNPTTAALWGPYIAIQVPSNNKKLRSSKQVLNLPIDIHGDYVSVPCEGCIDCTNILYKPSSPKALFACSSNQCVFPDSVCRDSLQNQGLSSSSFPHTNDACQVTRTNQYEGVEVQERATVEIMDGTRATTKRKNLKLNFICEQSVSPSHQRGAVGMNNNPHSFIHQLYKARQIPRLGFSLCFNSEGQEQQQQQVYLGHLGHHDAYDSPLVWAKQSPKSPKYYGLHLKRIYMANGVGSKQNNLQPLVSEALGAMSFHVLDSSDYSAVNGTFNAVFIQPRDTVTFLHVTLQDEFRRIFAEITTLDYNDAAMPPMTRKQFDSLPMIFLQFESSIGSQGNLVQPRDIPGFVGLQRDPSSPYDVLLAIPPSNYLEFDETTGAAYPTIKFSESSSSLGSNVLEGHEVIFDLNKNKIGFALRKTCPKAPTLQLSISTTTIATGDTTRDQNNNATATTSSETTRKLGYINIRDKTFQSGTETVHVNSHERATSESGVANDPINAASNLVTVLATEKSGLVPLSATETLTRRNRANLHNGEPVILQAQGDGAIVIHPDERQGGGEPIRIEPKQGGDVPILIQSDGKPSSYINVNSDPFLKSLNNVTITTLPKSRDPIILGLDTATSNQVTSRVEGVDATTAASIEFSNGTVLTRTPTILVNGSQSGGGIFVYNLSRSSLGTPSFEPVGRSLDDPPPFTPRESSDPNPSLIARGRIRAVEGVIPRNIDNSSSPLASSSLITTEPEVVVNSLNQNETTVPTTTTPEEQFVERDDPPTSAPTVTTNGLPRAIVTSSSSRLRVGPRAVAAANYIQSYISSDNAEFTIWHSAGMMLFFLGFCTVVLASREHDPPELYVVVDDDDDDLSHDDYGEQEVRVKQIIQKQPKRKGWFGTNDEVSEDSSQGDEQGAIGPVEDGGLQSDLLPSYENHFNSRGNPYYDRSASTRSFLPTIPDEHSVYESNEEAILHRRSRFIKPAGGYSMSQRSIDTRSVSRSVSGNIRFNEKGFAGGDTSISVLEEPVTYGDLQDSMSDAPSLT